MRSGAMSLLLATALGAGGVACTPAPSVGATDGGADGGTAFEQDPQICASCHLPEYQSADKHVGVKPTTCAVCHFSEKWRPRPAPAHAWWELTGKHTKARCDYCHENDIFKGTTRLCVTCHEPELDRAPHHENKPKACEQCHSTDAWKPELKKSHGAATAPSASASAAPAPSGAPSAKPTAPLPTTPPHATAAPTPRPTAVPTTPPTPHPTVVPTTPPVPTVVPPKPTPTPPPDVPTGASPRRKTR